jgi:hypothetical protein
MTLVTDWSYSKYIVGSSLFFQIPALYAYHTHNYSCAAASFITSILSINYWRHAKHSWRRDLDIYWARSAGLFYFIQGIQHSYVGIPGCMCMLFLYHQSCSQYEKNKWGNWYMYHMAFHGLASINQLLSIKLTLHR